MKTTDCQKDDLTKPEKEIICMLCDCCTPRSIMVCKVYFFIYIFVFLVLLIVGYVYKHYRRQLNVEKQTVTEISKRYLVYAVGIWMFTRIFYFGISWFPIGENGSYICMLEVVQNLPVLMMYTCFIVFHRFLLKIYIVMVQRDSDKNHLYINVYFWLMISILATSQIFETTAVCISWQILTPPDDDSKNSWLVAFHTKSCIIITLVLIFNTVIAVKVIPELNRQLNYSTIIWFAILLCVVFEVIMIYREFITFKQNELKDDNKGYFEIVMITYFFVCELILYCVLIGEIIHQIILMKRRLVKRKLSLLLSQSREASPIMTNSKGLNNTLEAASSIGNNSNNSSKALQRREKYDDKQKLVKVFEEKETFEESPKPSFKKELQARTTLAQFYENQDLHSRQQTENSAVDQSTSSMQQTKYTSELSNRFAGHRHTDGQANFRRSNLDSNCDRDQSQTSSPLSPVALFGSVPIEEIQQEVIQPDTILIRGMYSHTNSHVSVRSNTLEQPQQVAQSMMQQEQSPQQVAAKNILQSSIDRAFKRTEINQSKGRQRLSGSSRSSLGANTTTMANRLSQDRLQQQNCPADLVNSETFPKGELFVYLEDKPL